MEHHPADKGYFKGVPATERKNSQNQIRTADLQKLRGIHRKSKENAGKQRTATNLALFLQGVTQKNTN